jgi:hypothetical protein
MEQAPAMKYFTSRFPNRSLQLCSAVVALFFFVSGSSRADIVFLTPAGSSTSGGAVSAEADFTFGAGTVTVVLKNLTVDPKDVAQNLSALSFTLNSSSLGANSLSSSSSTVRTVAGDGTFSPATPGPSVSTGWDYSSSGTSITLDVLGSAVGPAHTLIGAPGATDYDNAKGSIAGNGPHNPFLDQTATFNLAVANATASTSIMTDSHGKPELTFQFGTTDNGNQTSTIPGSVPEPYSLVSCIGSAVTGLGLFVMARRRRVSQPTG